MSVYRAYSCDESMRRPVGGDLSRVEVERSVGLADWANKAHPFEGSRLAALQLYNANTGWSK